MTTTHDDSGDQLAATEGVLGVSHGGSGVDMSATGGTGHVVKQASAGAPFTTGPINAVIGTTTNDNADAGSVGEYTAASLSLASGVSLTTNTSANVISVSLTAGDWDCSGLVGFQPATGTSYTKLYYGISTTSATLGADFTYAADVLPATITGLVAANYRNTPIVRLSLAATTTVYLVANSTFTVSTMKASGQLRCRRVR